MVTVSLVLFVLLQSRRGNLERDRKPHRFVAIHFVIKLHNVVITTKRTYFPPFPKRVVKGDQMGRFLGITTKRVVPCRCLQWHVKEPYGMSIALGARP